MSIFASQMWELKILLTLSIIGFIVGFLCSMPLGGPVSILVTTNGLKGKLTYSRNIALGGAVVVFFYVFIGFFGLTKLYQHYLPYIGYVILVGSLFLIGLSIHIAINPIRLNKNDAIDTQRKGGGIRTGLMVNLLNPTLFVGWLISSFFFISIASSYGIDLGGVENLLNSSIESITNEECSQQATNATPILNYGYHLLNSLFYALFLSFGSVTWYYIFSKILVKNRERINENILNKILLGLGVVLGIFALFLIRKAVIMIGWL